MLHSVCCRALQACVVAMAIAICIVSEANAFGRHDYGLQPGQRWVHVESDYGNGSVSAPVRYTAKGPQIRLPGGNWIYCDHLCSETLRLATVDFWESEQADPDGGDSGCGLIGCRAKLYFRF